MRHTLLLSGLLSATTFLSAAGCGGDGDTSAGGGGQSSTTTDPTGGGGTGGTPTGGGGTGGTASGGGGACVSGGAGGATTTSSTTTTGTGGPEADHLVISEISVAPEGGELIEIHNPTGADVSLANYYLSDNSTYPSVASGGAWSPITNNPGTDFLARFPANAVVPAGGYKVIAFDSGFEAQYQKCPDFFMGAAALPCGGADVPALLATEAGSVVDTSNLSNSREMVVLFTWSGDTNDLLQDVDYVTWGDTFEAGTRADKTAVTGYEPDTAPDMQKGALAPGPTQSIERCAAELGEKTSGGNGITGHDETSEDLTMSFKLAVTPTPGAKNGCL